MKLQRLILLCSDAAITFEHLHGALQSLCEPSLLELVVPMQLHPAETPWAGRWNTFSVRGHYGQDVAVLGQRLDALVKALPTGSGEEVLAVFADPVRGRARAHLHPATGFARTLEGELFHVLREAAGWVDVDPLQLTRFGFEGQPLKSAASRALAGEDVQVSGAEPEPGPPLDDEDRFVENKLAAARAFMAQYRASKKDC